jgi:hypothetical protein
VSNRDDRTRFIGFCEFEALGWDEAPLIPPGRIGRRRRGAIQPAPDWRQERRMWRQLRAARTKESAS